MFSGLRGAIAFALAIKNTVTESRQLILSTTLVIVIVTVIFNGGMTFSVLSWLGIPIGKKTGQMTPLEKKGIHGRCESPAFIGEKYLLL